MTVLLERDATPARPQRRQGRNVQRRVRSESLLVELAAETDAGRRSALRVELVELNLDLAESIASRYAHRGVERDDLVQVASLGLVKAIDGFDPAAGHPFTSYAVPTIRGEVTRYFRDHGWVVRPPRGIQELQPRITRAAERLGHELGRAPRPSEIAEDLGVDLDEVIEAMGADGCFSPTSLDLPVGEDGERGLGDRLGDLDLSMSAAEARAVLAPAMRELGARDRQILYLRYFEGLRQREIGERLGVSQVQVSRLLTRAMAQLRERIGDVGHSSDH